jgi:hypothetical protein
MRYFALLSIFFVFKVNAQVYSGKILGAKDYPLAFAHIIGENRQEFAISDEKGEFSIQIQKSGLLFVSMVGYVDSFIIVPKTPSFLTIRLREQEYELPQIIILNTIETKKIKTTIESNKGKIPHFVFLGFGGKMAQKIDNHSGFTGKIDRITFKISKSKAATFVNLRIFSNEDGYPGTDLLQKNFLIPVEKGSTTIIANLDQELIEFPKKGCFVGIDLVDPKQKRRGESDVSQKIAEPGLKGHIVDQFLGGFTRVRKPNWHEYSSLGRPVAFDVSVKVTLYVPKK